MKGILFFALALLSLMLVSASVLNAGYRTDPWGSKTWTGPGRPPHWSPISARAAKPAKLVAARKLVGSERKFRHPRGSHAKGGFWIDKHNRWQHHRFRQSGYIYYRAPRVEKVIIEQKRRVPVYIPVQQKPARLQCAGSTITRRDSRTGEMYIEYVTSARDC